MPPFRDLRLRAELSQREMGELLDVSQRSISQFELGARTIPPYVAENLRVRF
ncbi:MAG: helix-turn-helix domain-containing protein, partial [Oscillospiraceae bacterium]|nr:helix-turn-helix domain-containing protein [Oscillospiraceae bacterium]